MGKKNRISARPLPPIFARNTAQVNRAIANILSLCSAVIILMVILSLVGFFEFSTTDTWILLIAGLFVTLMPRLLIRSLSDRFMKYYMIVSVSLFVGFLGAEKNIGIYITYALVPIMSCLYFEPRFVLEASVFSYLVMLASLYVNSATLTEVMELGRSRIHMFFALAAGFTMEFLIVTSILYYLVRRAKTLILEYNSAERALNNAEKERQMFNALCTNFTAAYCCDLMTDRMEPIKRKSFSHCEQERGKMHDECCYSEWIQHAFDTFVVKETSPDYLEVFDAKNLMRRLQTEESFVYRHRTLPNGVGMEYFEATVVRLYTDEHSFQIIMGYRPIDDIVAEEKKHQQEIESALQAAQRANDAKTNFLHRMSHDIRTPLNGIIGLLQIDEAHFDDPALVRENHKKMEIAANHLLSLINDVLQMSKLEDGHTVLTHECVSLFGLTQDIVNIIIDRAVENGIEWDYEKGKSVIPYPYIYGSPLHLRQIFLNIYGNCIKYNRPGGKITTIVDTLETHDNICTYRWTITDTGVGMSPEFLQHIFEPFAQERNDARSAYQGTGLGMAIVKTLLDKMGGTITVTSKESVGSKFVIVIPFEIAPAPEKRPEQLHASTIDIRGLHLLLAEDNDLNAEIAQTLLQDAGASVTVVGDGRQALELFETSPANRFDAILLDMMMPVMDGVSAARAIRALDRPDAKTIPIIAMTANAFAEDAQKCLDAGMNAHLAKPLEIDKVLSTLACCCHPKKDPAP